MSNKRKVKDNPRVSKNDFLDFEMAAGKGEIFKTLSGDWDSSKIKVLHHGIDTLKQFYGGLIIQDVYQQVLEFYEANDANSKELLSIGGYDWRVTSGRRGGYRYLLQNKQLGVIVLLGSFYCLPTMNGHHLKIELSPHFIIPKTIHMNQFYTDKIAQLFITQLVYTGIDVHLCADVQGWAIPKDLDDRLTTRCRRVFKASGLDRVEFDYFGDIAMKYGRGQSFRFGQASSIEFSVYNKTKQIKETHGGAALPFWEHVWRFDKLVHPDFLLDNDGNEPRPVYDPKKPVNRLEVRFHHSVLNQFERGSFFKNGDRISLRSIKDLAMHLTGLWRYSLNNFRLDSSSSYIDPFWQFMRDDLTFVHDLAHIDYIRSFKSELIPGEQPSERAVKVWLGLTCKMFKQSKYTIEYCMFYLKNSGLWVWLEHYYKPVLDFLDDIDDVKETEFYIQDVVLAKIS